nr:Flp1 family type IVb pilin [Butyrivibrio sp. NC2002]
MKTKVTNKLRKIEEGMIILKHKALGMLSDFVNDESGMGTVEVILIIVVLIGLVIVFKQQIDGLVENIFKTIKSDTKSITGM